MKGKEWTLSGAVKLLAVSIPLCMVIMFACDNVNTKHEEYLNRGEAIYIGAADSVSVYSGNHRIKFTWMINADPRIAEAVIYWNGRASKITIPVNRTTGGAMWMEATLDDMEEGEYIFEFVMKDKSESGYTSKPVQIAGAVLGDVYVENLRNRGVKGIAKLESGEMQITWEGANSATLLYSVVEYKDGDETISVEVPNADEKTLLERLETGDEVEIYAVHFPENGLENIYSRRRAFTMPKFERLIDKGRYADAFKPGDNTTPQPGNDANAWSRSWGIGDNRDIRQLWDNNTRNDAIDGFRGILHTNDQSTQWEAALFKFPHKFTIDLGVPAILSRLHLWPRTDNGSFTGHNPRYFEIWATDEPKVIADFEDQAAYEVYYRTTYVTHKPVDAQIRKNAAGVDDTHPHVNDGHLFIEAAPEAGIYNWQQDWVRLGDFEYAKPSGMNHNSRNDADNAAWTEGLDFSFPDTDQKFRYIRLVIKYPNWDQTNCINLGEVSFYGDDI
ncbi:MAG: hypothetical protein LBL04_09090 [Bacteroidales bacterium]|jgi:hypothetical protein|nr:hypothetical protein [Bacteroidales bacterium]